MNKNSKPSYSILGVEVDALRLDEALGKIETYLSSPNNETQYIVKPYVEFMTASYRNQKLQSIQNSAMLCLPDGISLQWAASFLYGAPNKKPSIFTLIKSALFWIQNKKWLAQCLPERFAGATFTKMVLDEASRLGWRVGIIGGPRMVEDTKSALHSRWPELELINVWSGFVEGIQDADSKQPLERTPELMKIISQIHESKLDILFVALGFPKQEQFMDEFRGEIGVKLMIGEGGTFDYDEMGGPLKRAPRFIRHVGLEWLWRLVLQPKRIVRQLAIPDFTWLIFRQARRDYRKKS